MKTAKFGGTSLADAARFRQVKRIVSADPELRFVVVSAPGKRSAEDKKVTDLLYDCHAAVKTGTDPETAFAPVAARFRQIVQELDLAIDLESELRQIEAALASGASEAYCVSRGEYLSGRMLAALLGWPFLDPAELHFFDADGFPQHKLAERSLTRRLRDMERAVMPGFSHPHAAARRLGYLRGAAGKRRRVGCLRKLDGRSRYLPRRSRNRAQRKGDSCHGL